MDHRKTSDRYVEQGSDLQDRLDATRRFLELAKKGLRVGDLRWRDVENDYRILVINASLRRQLETLEGAVTLGSQGLGHLAVAFVRASLEDLMYIKFLLSLSKSDSQELFLTLGNWDSYRSVIAQREHLGDEIMRSLWYPQEFLDQLDTARARTRERLDRLQKKYRWAGGPLPSAEWVAKQAGYERLYRYLHAATSRAVHFSAGEIMRRGWGTPNGIMSTEKRPFREHLALFSVDQLLRLYVDLIDVSLEHLNDAGISTDTGMDIATMTPIVQEIGQMGKVPLVHSTEWNFTPDGPLPKPN